MHTVLDLLQIAAALAGALAFALLCLGVWNVFVAKLVLDAQAQQDEEQKESFISALRRVVLVRFSKWNARTFSKKYQARIEKTLLHAGSPSELSAPEFIGLQEVGTVAFTLFGLLLWKTVSLRWPWVIAFTALGWFYPWIWLRDQLKKRHHAMTRAMPYNLDLLTLSVEAGLDFAQALGKVVDKGRQGPLVEEFGLCLKNIKLGKTREDALKMLAERCALPSLTTFTNALIQADRMGTSLGKILRIQSTQLRIERTHRAEKLANEAPVKMLFPLIACIFPTVFMVLFGPIIFQMLISGN